MSPFLFVANELGSDRSFSPGRLLSLTLSSSLSSPAQSLSARLFVEQYPRELTRAAIYYKDAFLFIGKVDEQHLEICAEGNILQVEARSQGGLLLDNEAAPYTYAGVSLRDMFNIFVAPYGFTLQQPANAVRQAEFTVPKGVSEWEAFCRFALRACGQLPYLRENRVLLEKPDFTPVHLIENSGEGLRFCKLEHLNDRCEAISQIYLRDDNGVYQCVVSMENLDNVKIARRRYMIPADEFGSDAQMDAVQRAWRSLWQKERLRVLLPGMLQAQPGQGARVKHGGLSFEGYYIEQVTHILNANGLFTQLLLHKAAYRR